VRSLFASEKSFKWPAATASLSHQFGCPLNTSVDSLCGVLLRGGRSIRYAASRAAELSVPNVKRPFRTGGV
jgi:hypothetical protein